MGKNKPIDLGIGTYMAKLQKNIRPTDEDNQNPPVDSHEDNEPEDKEEVLPGEPRVLDSVVGDKNEEDKSANSRRGRPKKSKVVVRNNQKLIRFDDAMCSDIAMVKVLHKVPMQDLVYIATARFMRQYFPKGKATKEGLELLAEEMKILYGKD